MLLYHPEPHQMEAIKFASLHHYCIIADDMGLGKSFESIATFITRSVGKFLVVCPAHLKYNWREELSLCQEKWGLRDILVLDDLSDVQRIFLHDYKVVIFNYEMLSEKALMELLFAKFPNVIADEAHYLKTVGALRTRAFHQYIQDFKPHRLLLLTGTPIENRVDEYYSLLLLCSYNPRGTSGVSIEEMSYHHFRNKFMKVRWRDKACRFKEHYGLKNKEDLDALKRDKVIRREATAIRGSTLQHQYITLRYGEENRELLEEFEAFEQGRSVDVTAKVESASRIAPLTAKYVLGLLEERDTPIVLFTAHKEPHAILKKLLEKKCNLAWIDADVKPEERHRRVKLFQEGKFDVILGTYKTMGTGYTMVKSADVVFNDPSWVPGEPDQAAKRIDRMGQDKACLAHHICGGRVSKYVAKRCNEKREVIKEVHR